MERTARAVEEAEVIALQEVERFWKPSGNVVEVAELSERLADCHWVYGPGWTWTPAIAKRTAVRSTAGVPSAPC